MTSILVTDSDETMCDLLETRLRRRGYEVHVAGDGLQGLAIYDQVRPKLVITDIMLPALNGYQLIQRIKRRNREAGRDECKIIVLSGSRSRDVIARCFHLGAADYVQKPFSPVELEARIRKQLASNQEECL